MTILAPKGARVGACRHIDPHDVGPNRCVMTFEEPVKAMRRPEDSPGDVGMRDVELTHLVVCSDCRAKLPMSFDAGFELPISQDFTLTEDVTGSWEGRSPPS